MCHVTYDFRIKCTGFNIRQFHTTKCTNRLLTLNINASAFHIPWPGLPCMLPCLPSHRNCTDPKTVYTAYLEKTTTSCNPTYSINPGHKKYQDVKG